MGKPPILNFACSENTKDQQKPFFYDKNSNLNLIKINGYTVPFVDVPPMFIPELYTKTRMRREDDDESIRMVEMLTKTAAKREGDDDDYSLLELLTKSKVPRESDDE